MCSATGNKGKPRDLSEAQLMAPWYVTGKLDETEAREVEKLAKEDEEFAQLIEEVKREQKASTALNEAMGELPPAVWERLEQSVEQERREQSRGRRAGLVEKSQDERFGIFRWPYDAAVASRRRGGNCFVPGSGRRDRIPRARQRPCQIRHGFGVKSHSGHKTSLHRIFLAERDSRRDQRASRCRWRKHF